MSNRRPRPVAARGTVRLDPVAWARVYGLDPSDREAITLDMAEWAHNLLSQAAEQSGVLAGSTADWAHK